MSNSGDLSLHIFHIANAKFLSRETGLILSEVNERTICGALAQYIRYELDNSEFRNYYVDVEYNRNNGKLKTIIDSHENIVNINCDIIVHSRGENIKQDNLIAIEMKKSTGREDEKQKDRERLKALTKDTYDNIWSYDGNTFPEHVCGYVLGIFYEITISKRKILIEYYKKGSLIDSILADF